MALMVTIINKRKGIVDKFIGDAIMALWGVPTSSESDLKNSLLACLDMRMALLEYNKGRGSKDKPVINIGMGINYGPVLAGQIGSNDRLEYTVIGDTVNLASRIESLNKPFGSDILVSNNVAKAMKSEFRFAKMAPIKVKGKAKPQDVYALLGLKSEPYPKNMAELRKMLGIKVPPKSNSSGEKYEFIKK